MFFSRNIGQFCTVFALVIAFSYAQNAFAQNAVPVPAGANQNFGDDSTTSDKAYYFDWTEDSKGNKVLNEVQSPTDNSFTVNIDSAKNLNRNEFTEGSDINGNFDSQAVPYSYGSVLSKGGAIDNSTSLGNIDAHFVKNNASSTSLPSDYENGSSAVSAIGGAIHNSGAIGNITGDYAGNYTNIAVEKYVSSTWGSETKFNYGITSAGGAIYNAADAQIQNINSSFLANSASTAFTLNYSNTTPYDNQSKNVKTKLNLTSLGGAVSNHGSIADINGTFIGNGTKAVLNSSVTGTTSGGSYSQSTNNVFENTLNSSGGAIYNAGSISNINGDFLSNNASSIINSRVYDSSGSSNGYYYIHQNEYVYSNGGAIYNGGTIGSVNSNFTGNYAYAYKNSNIDMNYTQGYFEVRDSYNPYASGGALYNALGAEIIDINGQFSDNYTMSSIDIEVNNIRQAPTNKSFAYSYGGAIYNAGNITSISGDFTNNHSTSVVNKIYTSNNPDSFFDNWDSQIDAYSFGGAIYNDYSSTTSKITGNFTNNSSEATSITTNSNSSQVQAYGGAIYNNNAEIGEINGKFSENSALASLEIKGDTHGYSYMAANAHGAAIYNNGGKLDSITGDFQNNKAKSSFVVDNIVQNISVSANATSGAVSAIADEVIGNFTSNSSISTGHVKLSNAVDGNHSSYITVSAGAGALTGSFDTIRSNFENNNVLSELDIVVNSNENNSLTYRVSSYHGAFLGSVKDFEGNFKNNSAEAFLNFTKENENSLINVNNDSSVEAKGGAASIQNTHTETFKADFVQNHTLAQGPFDAKSQGGAAYVYNEFSGYYIKDFISDFEDNYAKAVSGTKDAIAQGGAIYQTTYGNVKDAESKIINLNSNFTNNYTYAQADTANAYSQGGAVHNVGQHGKYWDYGEGDMGGMGESTEVENDAYAYIDNINGNYNSNYASSKVQGSSGKSYAQGGAIYNGKLGVIGSIKAVFSNNYTSSSTVDADSISLGGAIYNEGSLDTVEGTFSGNYASALSKSGEVSALGGAIYSEKSFTVKADNNTTQFSGNKTITESNGIRNEEQNAIFMGNNITNPDSDLTLTLNAINGGRIQFDDQISGGFVEDGKIVDTFDSYNLKVDGDSNSQVILNNDIINAKVTLDNTNLVMGREDIFDKSNSLTLNSGTVDMQNGQAGTVGVPELNINGNINVKVDADLSGAGSMDNFGSANINGNGSIIIDSINIVKDMDEGVYSTVLDFLNHNSVSTSLNVPGGSIMTSLYTYYLGINDNKQIIFERTEDIGGFASAIANKPPVTDYYITMEKEVINGWSAISGSEMQGEELNVHGNGNALDGNGNKGISIGAGKTMNIENVGKLVITETDETNPNAFQAFDKNGELKYYTSEGTTGWQNFVNNEKEQFGGIEGGAIRNSGNLSVNNVIFIDNHAYSSENSESQSPSGGAIYNDHTGVIENVSGVFINNSAVALAETTSVTAVGGAIYTAYGEIKNIAADFIGNSAEASVVSQGGAIFNGLGSIGNIKGNFINNFAFTSDGIYDQGYTYVASGGAIYNNSGNIGDINANFIGNYASSITQTANNSIAQGGAIVHQGQSDRTIGSRDENGNVVGGIVNSNFINNYARAESAGANASAKGGAIYTTGNLNIIADNGSSVFSGNKTLVTINKGTENEQTIETPNAIYVDADMMMHPDETVELTLKSVNSGVIRFEDQIDGSDGYGLNITGDTTGKVLLNNSIKNAKVTVDTVNLNLGKNDVFATSDVTMTSGTLGFINNTAEAQTMQSLNINGNVNLALDVDLAGEKMDTLPDGTVVSSSSQIGVSYLNLLNDAVKDKTIIAFAPEDYANQIQYTGENPIAYSKIYKYDVGYQINPDSNLGEFIFARGSSSNASDNFNPSVLPAPVTTQTGGYTTQLQTFNYAFQHSDSFMNIPYLDRMAMKNRNRYAFSPTGDATDMGVYSPLFTKDEAAGFWIKPYASFESVPLKNGPSVSNINYGTLVGYDSSMKSIANGFDRVITGYIGYNGASQRYSGVDAYQNGGLLGSTITLYKGNFFNATTASVGATVGDATGMYGSENYTMLLAGIANKTGYNFEFMKGKVILQPSMMISYSFVNTFDYTNAAGLRIKSDPLNAIQLSPGLKLIGNTKSGWQPYIGVNMVWNLLDKTKVTADDVRLPEMSIKPYVQYGVGVQKRFGESATGYAQAMIHNGGRNGVSLSAGFRWAVGKKK